MDISRKTIMWVLVILSLISLGSVNVKAAPSPVSAPMAPVAAAPAADCMTSLFNMTDCLDFVTQGSNATKPDKKCCPELAGMLDSNATCLCELFAKSKDYGITLDMKRALKLPSFCKLQTPDISLCSAIGMPVSAPGVLAPAGAPSSGALAGAPTSGASAGAPSSGASAGEPTSGASSSLAPTAMPPMAGEAAAGGKNGASSSVQFNVVAYLVAAAGLAMAFTHY